MVARIDSGSVGRRCIRELRARKIKQGDRRITLREPKSADRPFANRSNGPIRIVVEYRFGSLVANNKVPPLTEELNIGV